MNESTEQLIAEHNDMTLSTSKNEERYNQITKELSARFDGMGDEEQAEYFIDLVPSPFTSSVWYRHFRPFRKPEDKIYV